MRIEEHYRLTPESEEYPDRFIIQADGESFHVINTESGAPAEDSILCSCEEFEMAEYIVAGLHYYEHYCR